jgi:serine/threonine protein kinase
MLDLLQDLRTAKFPEDIFGVLGTDKRADLSKAYKKFVQKVHPDKNPNQKDAAEEAFNLLQKLRDRALKRIEKGTYGDLSVPDITVTIQSKTNEYRIGTVWKSGDITDIFQGFDKSDNPVIVKIARSPANNDLVLNESKVLSDFRTDSTIASLGTLVHVPELLDNFKIKQGGQVRQVNVLRPLDGYYTISEVLKRYPDGINPADAAWMLNRLFGALSLSHQAGRVHGAISPEHLLIRPGDHNGVLIDWSYSVKKNEVIKASSSTILQFAPSDIRDKAQASFGVDIYMAAKLFYLLVGGEEKLPTHPPSFRGFFRACCLGRQHRIQDVFEAYDTFNTELKRQYGKRKFREFIME